MTCAGGSGPLDMMHALISQHQGEAFSRKASDWFMHTEVRRSQDPQKLGIAEPFGVFQRPVIDAIKAIENHIVDPLDLNQLSIFANVGSRQFNRLFAHELNKSTMEFYTILRLKIARQLVTQSSMNLTATALATGFFCSSHFSQAHSRVFGHAPSLLRKDIK